MFCEGERTPFRSCWTLFSFLVIPGTARGIQCGCFTWQDRGCHSERSEESIVWMLHFADALFSMTEKCIILATMQNWWSKGRG